MKMETTHRFEMEGICPVDGSTDEYQVVMVFDNDAAQDQEVVTIESVLRYCREMLEQPCFQEDFTRSLATAFQADVHTSCMHSTHVHTTCHVTVEKGRAA